VALALLLVACGHSPGRPAVDRLVADGPAGFVGISVVASGGREAALPRDEWARVAPLLAARRLDHPEPLSSYGLDQPQARLVYRPRAGGRLDVDLGAPSFDGRLLYARPARAAHVYLLAADSLRPLLALAGVVLPPPA